MKILFATDGSDTAQQALTYLLSLPLPPDSELTLLTVIEKEIFRDENDTDIHDEYRESLGKTREMLESTAEDFLQATAKQVSARFTATRQVRYGHPAEEIVQAAQENNSDLVVVG